MATVTGTSGNDTVLVNSASAGVVPPTGATNAADSIRTLAGADTVVPGQGDDVVSLGGGSDLFVWNPGDGSDTANGNAGFDTHLFNGSDGDEIFAISDDGANVELLRNLGNIDMDLRRFERINLVALGGADRIDASGLTNPVSLQIDGGGGDDSIIGSAGADTIVGGAGNDTVVGGPGDDDVSLGGGSDLFVWNPGDGSDTANGNAGFDTHLFNGSDGDEIFAISDDGANVELLRNLGNIDMDLRRFERINLVALGGADRVNASELTNPVSLQIDGGAGHDSIIGSAGADTIVGGAGNDTVVGGPGDDDVSLGGGSDLFVWNPGDGSDTANGNAGFDTHLFNGSDGDEIFAISDDGANVELLRNLGNIDMDLRGFERINLVALGGDDRVDASGLTNPVSLQIDGGAGDDSIIGSAGADTISGGAGADSISGGAGADSIFGGAGADTISGGAGADSISGGSGNDSLSGGGGADTISGGSGSDTVSGGGGDDQFVFSAANFAGGTYVDWILGYSNAGGDEVDLGGVGIDSSATVGGDLLITLDTADHDQIRIDGATILSDIDFV